MEQDPNANLDSIVESAKSAFAEAASEEVLNQTKARFLGKSGAITEAMKKMRSIEPDERPAYGAAVNAAKGAIEEALEARRLEIRDEARAADLRSGFRDLTLPGRRAHRGAIHPLRLVEREMVKVFRELGYAVATGPEVEQDFHNYEALNFPPDHPARDMQDTFHVEDGRVLRTHTSPVQIRTMLANRPPIRICAPGRVYRADELDMTHSPVFHQVEGLVVDQGITMANLKHQLVEFVSRLFGKRLNVRLRPSFFPFTEPSVEVDVECPFCTDGCRVCSNTRWIEILGAGMVDPNVFAAVGIDPERYTGFAFGIGVERVAMLLYGVDDIRHFYENDLRFLAQFS